MPAIPPELRRWKTTGKGNQTLAFPVGNDLVRLVVGRNKRTHRWWCLIFEGDSDGTFLPESYPSPEAAQEAGFAEVLPPEWMR